MTQYNVHIFPVVRVLVCGIEAESMEEAVRKADAVWEPSAECVLNSTWCTKDEAERKGYCIAHTDVTDEVTAYLVDVVGDPGYEQSRWYTDSIELDTEMHPLTLGD